MVLWKDKTEFYFILFLGCEVNKNISSSASFSKKLIAELVIFTVQNPDSDASFLDKHFLTDWTQLVCGLRKTSLKLSRQGRISLEVPGRAAEPRKWKHKVQMRLSKRAGGA